MLYRTSQSTRLWQGGACGAVLTNQHHLIPLATVSSSRMNIWPNQCNQHDFQDVCGNCAWVDKASTQAGDWQVMDLTLWQSSYCHREEKIWKWRQHRRSRTRRERVENRNTVIAFEVLDQAFPEWIHSRLSILWTNQLLLCLSWLQLGCC